MRPQVRIHRTHTKLGMAVSFFNPSDPIARCGKVTDSPESCQTVSLEHVEETTKMSQGGRQTPKPYLRLSSTLYTCAVACVYLAPTYTHVNMPSCNGIHVIQTSMCTHKINKPFVPEFYNWQIITTWHINVIERSLCLPQSHQGRQQCKMFWDSRLEAIQPRPFDDIYSTTQTQCVALVINIFPNLY